MLDSRSTSECGCSETYGASDLMTVETAMALAQSMVAPIAGQSTVPLSLAPGRVIASDIRAREAMPFFDNSAMDGFALRRADLEGRDSLPIAGTVAAGASPCELPIGAALRIFTGAPVPLGADAVAMVELCRETGGDVRFLAPPAVGDNIRRKGSDQTAGQLLIGARTRLAPHHVGLLAANGIAQIDVVRRPRVAVFSTGDELSEGPLSPGQIPDANRPMLLALARHAGGEADDLGILPDEPQAAATAFGGIADRYDLILSSGAVSMGGKDHIREALVAAGGDVNGWRAAVKPGKPVMFGRLGTAAFTGLPGNPFAVHVGFHLFAAPQISRLLGMEPAPFAPVPARAGFDWTRKPGRAEVFPVRLAGYDQTGLPVLERLGKSVSATLLPLAQADGLAIVPAETAQVRAGEPLRWHPFCQAGGQI